MIRFKNRHSSGAENAGGIRTFTPPADTLSQLKAGLISDDEMYARLSAECSAVRLRSERDADLISPEKINILIISSLSVTDGGLFPLAEQTVRHMLTLCRERNIPSVIWDCQAAADGCPLPDWAELADYIFCADSDRLTMYAGLKLNAELYFLPLAANIREYAPTKHHTTDLSFDTAQSIQSPTYLPEIYFNAAAAMTDITGKLPPAAKLFFGNTLVCAEDTAKYDEFTLKKMKFAALRKTLSENLYSDRLENICNAVFGITMRASQPKVTVFARPADNDGRERIVKMFDGQAYKNKELIFISSRSQTVKNASNGEFFCFFSDSSYYPENYIGDLMTAFVFSSASAVGAEQDKLCEATDRVILSSGIAKVSVAGGMRLGRLTASTAVADGDCLAVCCPDYLPDYRESPAKRQSHIDIDSGVEVYDIIRRTRRFIAEKDSIFGLKFDGEGLLSDDTSCADTLGLSADNGRLIIKSRLDEGRYEYIFIPSSRFSVGKYAADNKINVLFKCEREALELTCVLLFFDSSLNKLGAAYPRINVSTAVTLPDNTGFVQLGFRIKGSGNAKVEYISVTKPDCDDSGKNLSDYIINAKTNENRISIFGSCVSRDLLAFSDSSCVELINYIARQSVISAVCAPVELDSSLLTLSSAFQNRMVAGDFGKNAFALLSSRPSDYLIIDLIDERFPLKIIDNSYITRSNEFRLSVGRKYENCPEFEKLISGKSLIINGENAEKYIELFCRRIRANFRDDRIILHRALMADCYTDENGELHAFPNAVLADNDRLNGILNTMYDLLQKYLPGINVLDIPQPTASQGHKWGLAPMHYSDSYYSSVMEMVKSIITVAQNE